VSPDASWRGGWRANAAWLFFLAADVFGRQASHIGEVTTIPAALKAVVGSFLSSPERLSQAGSPKKLSAWLLLFFVGTSEFQLFESSNLFNLAFFSSSKRWHAFPSSKNGDPMACARQQTPRATTDKK